MDQHSLFAVPGSSFFPSVVSFLELDGGLVEGGGGVGGDRHCILLAGCDQCSVPACN